jgi:excisionase family DNA binding protein
VADSISLSPRTPLLGRSVSIDQAACLLRKSRRTIYNWIRDGRLRTVRTIGGSQRVLLDSLHELGVTTRAFAVSIAPPATTSLGNDTQASDRLPQ